MAMAHDAGDSEVPVSTTPDLTDVGRRDHSRRLGGVSGMHSPGAAGEAAEVVEDLAVGHIPAASDVVERFPAGQGNALTSVGPMTDRATHAISQALADSAQATNLPDLPGVAIMNATVPPKRPTFKLPGAGHLSTPSFARGTPRRYAKVSPSGSV